MGSWRRRRESASSQLIGKDEEDFEFILGCLVHHFCFCLMCLSLLNQLSERSRLIKVDTLQKRTSGMDGPLEMLTSGVGCFSKGWLP